MVAPICPVASICGGCPLLLVDADVARSTREARLRAALRIHLRGTSADMPIHWVALEQPEGYRRRVRMRIFDSAQIGFFNPLKYEGCVVLTAALRTSLSELVSKAPRHEEVLSLLHHFELREPDAQGRASAYFVKHESSAALTSGELEQMDEWLEGMHFAIENEPRPVPMQRLTIPRTWQWVPISSFLQVNQAINARLVEDLLDTARQHAHATFCDLYCGSGNFTLPLLTSGLTGMGVEIDPLAANATHVAASAQGHANFMLQVGDAGVIAETMAMTDRSFDLVVVDPPRAGVRRGLAALSAITRKHLAYCSCNVATLARDLALLTEYGFVLQSITLYDMFKYTDQVECLVWLQAPKRY